MPRRYSVIPLALLCSVALVAVPSASAATAKTKISGKVSGAKSSLVGLRVMALPTKGSAVAVAVKSNGSFSISVPRSAVNGLSLQLISKKGAYLGPVVVYRKGTKGATRLRTTKASAISVGTVKLMSGYGTLAKALKSSAVLAAGQIRLTSAGAPVGAGKLGLIRKAGTARAAAGGKNGGVGGNGGNGGFAVAEAPGGGCSSSASTESGSGGDCDQDGVPNAVDVDDNGNMSLDGVDQSSAQTSALLSVYFSLRPHFLNQTNVYADATPSSINSFLGSSNEEKGLSMAFWLPQQYIDVNKVTTQPLANVWVECTSGQPWCYPGTPTAKVGGMSPFPRILPSLSQFEMIQWADYHGSSCSNGTPCVAASGSDRNSLVRYNSPQNQGLPVWSAAVRPSSSDTVNQVVPGSVVTLKGRTSSGATIEQPLSLSPYFVTSPALASYTVDGVFNSLLSHYPLSASEPGASMGNRINVGRNGKITVEFWRPQRFALPGESGNFYDVGGLKWGARIESFNENGNYHSLEQPTSCDVSELNGLSPITPTGPDAGKALPTIDSQTADQVTNTANASTRTIGFTIDVEKCLSDAGVGYGPGWGTMVSLIAEGAQLPGGANSTGFDFEVAIPDPT